MFHKRLRNFVNEQEVILQRFVATLSNTSRHHFRWHSTSSNSAVLLRKLKKSERKPLVTSVIELKREARLRKKERQKARENSLQPPANGLLVKSLIPTAHEVYAARSELFNCISTVIKRSIVHYCRVCGEVHIGHPPHKIRTCNFAGSAPNKEHSWETGGMKHVFPTVRSFHLYDRIGRAVTHKERLQVDRIPAIVELCIQAGVDISEYPTKRRAFPIYSIAGRIVDFEKRFSNDNTLGKDFSTYGFQNDRKILCEDTKSTNSDDLTEFGIDEVSGSAMRGMKAWETMILGAEKLMGTYGVQTCGYCSEVQVGPKGHKVRNCQAYKHQMRDGQHAWQEATVDDLVPPVFVWHLQHSNATESLMDVLKSYYGVLPAVVELFSQAGASVSERYSGLMKEDVAVPRLDEMKLVI